MNEEARPETPPEAALESPEPQAMSREDELRLLAAELEGLEDEHRFLSEKRRLLLAEVAAKRTLAKERSSLTAALRAELVKLKARENAAQDELVFLEGEKARQETMLADSTQRLRANLDEVEKTTRQIEFIKGELEALALHVETFKDKVPDKFASVDYLEKKISQTEKEFTHLIDRMKEAGKGLNLAYYQKKRELRRKYDPYGFEG